MSAILNLPDIRPSFLLDFANSGRVDPRIQGSRASSATCWGPNGVMRTVGANVPRIDFDPLTGQCKGLLVEAAAPNLARDTRQPSIGGEATRVITGESQVIAPDGLPVNLSEESTEGGEHYLRDVFSGPLAAGSSRVQRIFVKATPTEDRRLTFRFIDPTASYDKTAIFSVTAASCTILLADGLTVGTKEIGAGWFMAWAAVTAPTAFENLRCRVQFRVGEAATYVGTAGKGLFLYERQVEDGLYPSSVISAAGTPVTRASDNLQLPLGDWFNPAEGTLMVTGRVGYMPSRTLTLLSLDDGTSANRIQLRQTAQRTAGGIVFTGGATQSILQPPDNTWTDDSVRSLAISYSSNETLFATTGYASLKHTGVFPAINVNRLVIGGASEPSLVAPFSLIEKVAYYPRKLTQSQLERLVEQ